MKFLPVLLFVALAGCSERSKVIKSGIMTESGRVVDTVHTNASSHTEIDFQSGINMEGDLETRMVPVTTRIPETWGVVFRCEHGNKFVIQGETDRYKGLWNRLDPGMDVIIHYKEEYKVTENKAEDGTWHVTSKELIDYDFLDATAVLSPERE